MVTYSHVKPALVGGWGPASPNDKYIQEAATAAIAQGQKRTGHHIELVKVDAAVRQIVSGEIVRSLMEVRDNGVLRRVDTTVFSQPWTKTEQLVLGTSPFHATGLLIGAMATVSTPQGATKSGATTQPVSLAPQLIFSHS